MSNLAIEPLYPDASVEVLEQIAALLRRSSLSSTGIQATFTTAESLALYFSSLLDPEIRFVALQAGRVVGYGALECPAKPQPNRWFSIDIDPSYRNRGYGNQLWEHLLSYTSSQDILNTWVDCPLHGRDGLTPRTGSGAVDPQHPSSQFLLHRGFELATISAMSRLQLPVSPKITESLTNRPLPAGYKVVSVGGDIPRHRFAEIAELLTHGEQDQPGAEEIPSESWTVEKVADDLGKIRRQKRYVIGAGILDTNDALVSISYATAAPHNVVVTQGWTVVDRNHRGIGLGSHTKAELVRKVAHDCPRAAAFETENAYHNAPMRAINEKLGFKLAYQGGIWRRTNPPKVQG